MKKLILIAVIVTGIVAVGWEAHRRIVASGDTEKPNRSVAVAVEVQPVREGMIRDIGVFSGSLVPRSLFVVASKATGWLRKLFVDIGDPVTRNEVIAVLDDEQFIRQVEQAQAELQVAKANAENGASALDLAKREYERVTALREKQIASVAEMDAAAAQFNASQTQMKVTLAQVAQKEAALEAAKLQLSYTQVRAFWEAGDPNRVVGERFVDEGALVQINQPIVSILENNPLVAVVFVIERDYPKIQIGQQVMITTDAFPGQTFAGHIQRIAPLIREASRQARVEIEVPNPGYLLKPGMFIRAQVEFATHQNATLVPFSALVRRSEQEGVFLVEETAPAAPSPPAPERTSQGPAFQVRFVPVTIGIVNRDVVEVVEPEISGSVVTLGNHLLEDGSRVTLPQHRTAGTEQESTPSGSTDGSGSVRQGGGQ
ncbi:MAG: efflux RND transporter periplasmic adaptor subunit [Sedimentisphaerales bacterium]|jgi:RND family efflux transporter MFP subunit|nr:efflux RND transporter periplasmic adaptor subunit [Sedimentisphaerales bacterium]NLT75798.1 efflux RND transporter periplasmic adaptor subunit [Planctomycetota bacterium]